jgi:hypothetical protein
MEKPIVFEPFRNAASLPDVCDCAGFEYIVKISIKNKKNFNRYPNFVFSLFIYFNG